MVAAGLLGRYARSMRASTRVAGISVTAGTVADATTGR
jgi:hypothetical protein